MYRYDYLQCIVTQGSCSKWPLFVHTFTYRVTREHINLRITEDLFIRLAAFEIARSSVSLVFILRTYEGVLISPYPKQEGNKPQRPNSGFIQHTPHEGQYTS